MTFDDDSAQPLKRAPPRDAWTAIKRGLRGRCPSCGRGRILRSYLKVEDACPACGEEMHHHRADDFPPYITIFAVGYILGGAMLIVDDMWPNLPMVTHFVLWPALCVLLSLCLLPIFKGGLVAYQWALRMHGFETAHRPASQAKPEQASRAVGPGVEPVIHRSAA